MRKPLYIKTGYETFCQKAADLVKRDREVLWIDQSQYDGKEAILTDMIHILRQKGIIDGSCII